MATVDVVELKAEIVKSLEYGEWGIFIWTN
jgi:hypothetical protein